MGYKVFSKRCRIYFSAWGKKGYSIFSGLKCEVHISRLALHMYDNILLKSSSNGVIVNTDTAAEEYGEVSELRYMSVTAGCIKGKVYPVIRSCGEIYG